MIKRRGCVNKKVLQYRLRNLVYGKIGSELNLDFDFSQIFEI